VGTSQREADAAADHILMKIARENRPMWGHAWVRFGDVDVALRRADPGLLMPWV
jgi:hypothetical protein